MAGIIEVKDQGKLRIYDADNSHYIDIVVPSSVTANRTITIPDASFTVPQVTNATHSGEVTGATALTIADNIVDEANLKVSNSPTNGYNLTAQSGNTGGLTWAAAPTSDYVKLIDTDISSAVTGINVTGWIANSTYQTYVVRLNRMKMSAADNMRFHFINDSGSVVSDQNYIWSAHHVYGKSSFGADQQSQADAVGLLFGTNNLSTSYHKTVELHFSSLDLGGNQHTIVFFKSVGRVSGTQIDGHEGWLWYNNSTQFTNSSAGFALDRTASGSFNSGNISVYGIK